MEELDTDVVNLAKSIRKAETGDEPDAYNKIGDNGTSRGGYQFQDATWKEWSKKHLGVDNAPLTVENQNKVAYKQIKEWKDKGLTPAQIASKWNSGDENAYQKAHKGTTIINGKPINYDTPAYTAKVSKYYNEMKGGIRTPIAQPQPQEKPFAQKTRTEIINEDLNKRGEQLKTGVESLIGGKEKTGQTRASGLLQTVGAGAGALGDVVSAGLRLIPGVKQIEGAIGTGVENFAQTDVGKSVFQSMKQFSEEHPELSKDLEAGFNIVTAIPILKGLGVAKNLAFDAASMALKKQAENTFTEEATRILSKTIKGQNLLRKNPEAVSSLVKERIIPDVKKGALDTFENRSMVARDIKRANTEVKNLLRNDTTVRVADENLSILNNVINGYTDRLGRKVPGFPNSKFTGDSIVDIAEDLTPHKNAKLWDKFRKGEVSLNEINELRSDLDQAVKTVYTSMNKPPISKEVGSTLASAMRDFVQTFKPETQPFFQKMTNLFEADDILKSLNGKSVKPSGIFETIQNITTDVPAISAIGKKIGSKGPEATVGMLKRTGKNAKKTTEEQLKKLPGLFSGFLNK